MGKCDALFERVSSGLTGAFRRYGELVGRHPLPFIICPILVFGGLGAGLAGLQQENDMEVVYFPKNSRALYDRQFIRDTFPDNASYIPMSSSSENNAATFIFKTKGGQSIFEPLVTQEISGYVDGVWSLSSQGKTYKDLCAVGRDGCIVYGDVIFRPDFRNAVASRMVTYPIFNDISLDNFLANVTTDRGKLVSATILTLSFQLAKEPGGKGVMQAEWKDAFLKYAADIDPSRVELAYKIPESLGTELDRSTKGDMVIFSLTMTMMCTYASFVSAGGNPVSSRSLLAIGGILAAGLAIVGSMGLLSALGVRYVNIVGVVPFLIIGIGVDDMFLMMTSWSEHLPSDPAEQDVQHVPVILGRTLASAGIGITITSVTDLLAFAIGTFSVFMSVTNFSLYAGVAVLFCYLANITLFAACMAYHGRRVFSSRHQWTCRVTKPREQLLEDGRSACYAQLCGGSPPAKERDDESLCEKFPSTLLPLVFKNKTVSVVIIFLFGVYLVAAIYGAVNMKEGLLLKDLVPQTSYFYTYLELSSKYFPTRIPVGFYIKERIDYLGKDGQLLLNLLEEAQGDVGITAKSEICWLRYFMSRPPFNASTAENFVSNLILFLESSFNFKSDVVLDNSKKEVIASRCFVLSRRNSDQYANSALMVRMRVLADASPLPVFAYHWSFVAYEQFLAVLPATLQLVGCAVAVMTVVTFLFLPHPLMVLLVVLTILMILTGIFGSLHVWGLTLSSITMMHLIMSVGFSVDFSAHVCAAYLLSPAVKRVDRARDAIRHAASPILNGAISTMLGVLLLVVSSSFIFLSFFKVMFAVIFLGFLHAVFFLPAILSFCGPERTEATSEPVTEMPTSPATSPQTQQQTPENRDAPLAQMPELRKSETSLSIASGKEQLSNESRKSVESAENSDEIV